MGTTGRLALLAVSFVAFGSGAAPAADGTPTREDFTARFEIDATPYVWMAGLNGTIRFRPDLPLVHINEPFSEILSELDAVFPVRLAVRHDRLTLSADIFCVATRTPVSPEGIVFGSGAVDHSVFFATMAAGYRVADSKTGSIDLVAGARLWSFRSDVTLNPAGPGPEVALSTHESWIDPIVGIGGRLDLTGRLHAEVYADVGGFRDASLTWQLIGTFGYSIKDHLDLSAGYRFLHVQHDDNGVTRNVDFSGPIIAATLRY